MTQRKQVIFLCAAIFTACTQGFLTAEVVETNPYGVVEKKIFDEVPDATVEWVTFYPKTEDGSDERIERKGILVRYPDAEGTILICHGFMCDKFDVAFLRNIFPKRKFNIMTFDFRAHGENNNGQFCTFGKNEALDVQAAANFLKHHPNLAGKPLFVYGFSMGAVASIEAQAQDNTLFDAMILDCPFDSSKNLIKKGLSKMKVSILGQEFDIPGRETLERYAFHPYVQTFLKIVLKTIAKMDTKNIQTNICPVSPKKSVRSVTVPCFFIHCKKDELVPVEAVKKIYDRAQGYKQFWLTQGRRHYDSLFYAPERYAQKVKLFLYKVINGDCDKPSDGIIIEDDQSDKDSCNTNILTKEIV